jgi:ketosteroid isomerase-like protein
MLLSAVPLSAQGSARTATTNGSTDVDSIAVAKVVSDFHHALSSGDSTGALRLLSGDAVILESGGVESRAEYRSHHLPADIEFAKAVASNRGPLQVSVKGNVAWTAATNMTKGKFKGKAVDSTGAESMILTRDTAGWRIRSIHWSSRRRTTSG